MSERHMHVGYRGNLCTANCLTFLSKSEPVRRLLLVLKYMLHLI
eukprot:SAG11_NODE_1444_length_4893_cov_7.649979_6_plen_44_part_00